MAQYRHHLPQLDADVFLTDGGLETTLIFDEGIDLPDFAAFPLLRDPDGRAALVRYFDSYVEIARRDRIGIVLETPTWRANPDWATRQGYAQPELDQANRDAVDLLVDVRRRWEAPMTAVVISGCVGPRGDGYRPDPTMSPDQARDYHSGQVRVFAETEADLVTGITMTYPAEAVGLVEAAASVGIPVVISFTVETDGRLPTGQTLAEAVETVDAATQAGPAYYMVNCAHPTHFADVLAGGAAWTQRLRGVRANASKRSHAELDEAEELDAGNPAELARDYLGLRATLPRLTVLGGCCGTSHRHVDAISAAVAGTP